jgi:hypothetical protein
MGYRQIASSSGELVGEDKQPGREQFTWLGKGVGDPCTEDKASSSRRVQTVPGPAKDAGAGNSSYA